MKIGLSLGSFTFEVIQSPRPQGGVRGCHSVLSEVRLLEQNTHVKKTPYFIVASVLLVMVFLFTCCTGFQGLNRHMGPEYEAETASWLQVVQDRAGNGMWLVTRGYHTGDDVVAIATDAPLSHAAVLDLDRLQVIEAVGKGVVATDLKKFLKESHRMVLIQPPDWTDSNGEDTVARARSRLGEGYDFLGTVGLPDDQRWYCSELAVWASGVKVDRIGLKNVLHPKTMPSLGKVLFDSGQRNGQPDQ